MSKISISDDRYKNNELKKITVKEGYGRDRSEKEYYVDNKGNLFEKQSRDRGGDYFSQVNDGSESSVRQDLKRDIEQEIKTKEQFSKNLKEKNIFGKELETDTQQLKELNALLSGGGDNSAAINNILGKIKNPAEKEKAQAAIQKKQHLPAPQPQVQASAPQPQVQAPAPQVQEDQQRLDQERIQQELLENSQERIKNQQRKDSGESPFLDPFRNKNRFHAMGSPTTYL